MGGSKAGIVRERIWSRLRDVALPDSRFHLNFAEVIPDFAGQRGGDRPAGRASPSTRAAATPSSRPDNCLVDLRRRMLARRQVDGGLDLRHLSRLPCCSSPAMVPQGPGAVRRLARRHRAFRPADHAGRDRRAAAASTSWSPAPRRSRSTASASARATASSISNGACSPTSASSTRRRRSPPSSTTCRWSRTSSYPSPTDILVDLDRDADAPDPGRAPRAAAARHQVGAARSRSRSPRRRRSRSCNEIRGRSRLKRQTDSQQPGRQIMTID